MIRKLKIYSRILLNGFRSVFGSSYWHVEQGLGESYIPGELEGYYNNLKGKTSWQGPFSDDGIPLNKRMDNSLVFHPTTIVQKALGHWDKWIESGKADNDQKIEFEKLVEWGMENQDSIGGFKIWSVLDMEAATDYSAMTQGEWGSLLARLYTINHDDRYIDAATKALTLMILPVNNGGTSRLTQEGLVLEERPLASPNTILNGWISAIYGLHDYLLAKEDKAYQDALDSTLMAFVQNLHQYNAGFWSYYDTNKNIASPFYQKLHIAQLTAIEKAFPDISTSVTTVRKKFEQQQKSSVKKTRAIMHKAMQKLIHPPKAVLK